MGRIVPYIMENKKWLKPPTSKLSKSYLKYPHISRSYPSKGTSTLPCANGTFQLMSWRSWSTPCDITFFVHSVSWRSPGIWQNVIVLGKLPFHPVICHPETQQPFASENHQSLRKSSIINNHCYNISEITSSMVQLFSTQAPYLKII